MLHIESSSPRVPTASDAAHQSLPRCHCRTHCSKPQASPPARGSRLVRRTPSRPRPGEVPWLPAPRTTARSLSQERSTLGVAGAGDLNATGPARQPGPRASATFVPSLTGWLGADEKQGDVVAGVGCVPEEGVGHGVEVGQFRVFEESCEGGGGVVNVVLADQGEPECPDLDTGNCTRAKWPRSRRAPRPPTSCVRRGPAGVRRLVRRGGPDRAPRRECGAGQVVLTDGVQPLREPFALALGEHLGGGPNVTGEGVAALESWPRSDGQGAHLT